MVTQAARNTLVFTAFGFTGGLALGLLVALMRLSTIRPYRWAATVYVDLIRGLPALLVLIFIAFGLPIALGIRIPGTYGRGAVALAIVASAYIAEVIRAGIEAVPRGQMEAARSLGMSRGQAMRRIVLPQAFRLIIPPMTNELVLLLKDTALISVIGVTEATKELTRFGRDGVNANANATPLVVAGLVYLALTIPMTRLAAYLERRAAASK
ncbi:MAG: amino acid ABC transporter permease [Dehalococcoidia bacterium]|nr:amino acid ABC transporter permease [Dehalococcoidia bacterium]